MLLPDLNCCSRLLRLIRRLVTGALSVSYIPYIYAELTDPQNLLFEKRDGIGYLTLNRPDKLNALSRELMAELRLAPDMIEDDPEVKVVILTGAGRAFSAGFDIETKEGKPEIYDRTADEWRSHLKQNIDLVTLFDITRTEEQEAFNKISKEKGLRAALDWRDALFKEED